MSRPEPICAYAGSVPVKTLAAHLGVLRTERQQQDSSEESYRVLIADQGLEC